MSKWLSHLSFFFPAQLGYNLHESNKSFQSKIDKKKPAKPESPGTLSLSFPIPSQQNSPKLHFCVNYVKGNHSSQHPVSN